MVVVVVDTSSGMVVVGSGIDVGGIVGGGVVPGGIVVVVVPS